METHTEKAMFGAGCFWGVEAAFRQIEGVMSTSVGYAGGHYENPTYKDVCSGKTGHAEVVQVTYNPERISYDALLDVFWKEHDPTTPNRQGPDFGTQYRSAIYFYTDKQKTAAVESLNREQTNHRRPIVTEIELAGDFYEAEDYHQQYLEKRGLSTCKI